MDLATPAAPDPDLVGMLTELFDDYRAVRPAPTQHVDFDPKLWGQLAELGLTRLTTPEDRGGSGGTWVDAAALLGLAAGAAVPVPLAENDVLASWLLASAGLPADDGLRTVCRPDADGVAYDVPWAGDAASVVALWVDGETVRVADVPVRSVSVEEGRNLAGQPSATVRFAAGDLAAGTEVDARVAARYRLRGSLARCAQSAGAMERVVEVVLTHVNERVQFGRPIGRFQAVQHLVSDIAAETALARAATDAAVARAVTASGAADWDDPQLLLAVAVARSCVGHAVSVVVRGAHQALGAIGTTVEHELHTLTKPLLQWRGEFGTLHEWDAVLTDLAVAAGRDGLWPLLTGTEEGRS